MTIANVLDLNYIHLEEETQDSVGQGALNQNLLEILADPKVKLFDIVDCQASLLIAFEPSILRLYCDTSLCCAVGWLILSSAGNVASGSRLHCLASVSL